jgi:hypothetical protein
MQADAKAVAPNRYVDYFAPRLRDVILAILAQLHLEDKPAFLSALCECREWASAGIRLRWGRVRVDRLARIVDVLRRQLYADHIQDFDMWHLFWGARKFAAADVLRGLVFPRLRSLHASLDDGQLGAAEIAPFLQPRLMELWCGARHIAEASVRQQLVTQCRELGTLYLSDMRCWLAVDERRDFGRSSATSLDQASDASTSADDDCCRLRELVKKLPALHTLTIHPSYSACGADAFVPLASHERLATLRDVFFDSAALRHVLQRVAQPFPVLRSLHAQVASDALGYLAEAAPLVAELQLIFRGPGAGSGRFVAYPTALEAARLPLPALGTLAQLRHLREVRLTYPSGMAPMRGDLAPLQQLPPQLRHLELTGAAGDLYLRDYCDADFAALVSHLPRLVVLEFYVRTAPGRLTAAAFRIAGEACRQLELLSLICKPFLWALEGACERPLFPLLGGLWSFDPVGDGEAYWDESDWR